MCPHAAWPGRLLAFEGGRARFHVGTGTKALPGAGEDRDAYVRLVVEGIKRGLDFLEHSPVHGIHRRPVDSNSSDVIAEIGFDDFAVHEGTSCGSCQLSAVSSQLLNKRR